LFIINYKKKQYTNDESYSSLNESGEDSVVIRQDEVTFHSLDDNANSEELLELLESDSLNRRSQNAAMYGIYADLRMKI